MTMPPEQRANYVNHLRLFGKDHHADTLEADGIEIARLTTALSTSRAETAAAYERAAQVARQHEDHSDNAYAEGWDSCAFSVQSAIRALATPDQSAALDAVKAEARADGKLMHDRAVDYLRIAAEIGSCGDGGCVILQQKGQHTNGGCRCLDCLDRSELRRVNGLLIIAQSMAKSITKGAAE